MSVSSALGPPRIEKPLWWEIARGQTGNGLIVVAGLIIGINGVTNGWDWSTLPGRTSIFAAVAGIIGILLAYFSGSSSVHWQWKAGEVNHELEELQNTFGQLSKSRTETFRMAIQVVAKDLKLGDSERITLFGLRDDGVCMTIGRFSSSSKHDRVHNKTRVGDEGCIAAALGSAGLVVFDIDADHGSDHSTWLLEQSHHGLSMKTAEALVMPARSYAAHRIRDQQRSVGVVVCESVSHGEFTKRAAEIESEIRHHEIALAAFIAEALSHGAYLTAWQQAGI